MRFYRMNSEGEDPEHCLTEEGQWTAPWGDSEENRQCDKCGASGRTEFACWSCLLTGARDDCPACSGRVRWEDECPVCRGSGRIDGKPRHGVSVFPTVEGLYHYMLGREADVDQCQVVELEGGRSDDVDFDADEGALLVIPTAVLACERVDPAIIARVQELSATTR